jgi:hypothetical protein
MRESGVSKILGEWFWLLFRKVILTKLRKYGEPMILGESGAVSNEWEKLGLFRKS